MGETGDIASAFGDFFSDYGVPIGIGAQAAGTLMRKKALEKVRAAQALKMREEAARQHELQQQRDARFAAVLPQVTPEATEAQRSAIAGKYRDYMQPTLGVADAGEYVTGKAGAPTEVRERADRAIADAKAKAKSSNDALANLQSYSGQKIAQNTTLNDAAGDITRIARASERSANILPYELTAAQSKGDRLNTLADISNGLGSISFLYGATAAKKPVAQKPPVQGSGLNVNLYGQGDGLNLPSEASGLNQRRYAPRSTPGLRFG